MQYRINEPVFTRVLPTVADLEPAPGSVYISGVSTEDRSRHTKEFAGRHPRVTLVHIDGVDRGSFEFDHAGTQVRIGLRSSAELKKFVDGLAGDAVYLDITGLPHHVWAPILRAIRSQSRPSFVVYVEPSDYKFSEQPTATSLFDLSEKIEGIAPLPGFASLSFRSDDNALFVPLLGFEGARFAFMLEAVLPKPDRVRPVIGVPGFRPEYPFHAFAGNRSQIEETRCWTSICYAAANCPFSVYQILSALAQGDQPNRLRIGVIGTKPHALGAVLYYLDYPNSTELLYDHPVRKPERTSGTRRVCLYDLSLLPLLRPERDPRLR